MGGSGRGEEPPRPPGLGGSPPTWVEAAAGGVDRVTRANTHPALRPAPASRAAPAPPRPVTRGRPDRHAFFPGAGRRPAGPTCPARRGGAVGPGGPRPGAPALRPPPGPAPPPCALRPGARAPPRPPGPAAPPPEPGGKEGRRCPLRASPGCSPLRRVQNTQPGSRAKAGARAGRGHPSAGPGGKGGPGRGGRGRAPAARRPLLGRALPSRLKKKPKGRRWRRSLRVEPADAGRGSGGEGGRTGVPAAPKWPRVPKVIPHPPGAPLLCARARGPPRRPPRRRPARVRPPPPETFLGGPLTPEQTSHGPGPGLERGGRRRRRLLSRACPDTRPTSVPAPRPPREDSAPGALCPRDLSFHVAALGPGPRAPRGLPCAGGGDARSGPARPFGGLWVARSPSPLLSEFCCCFFF